MNVSSLVRLFAGATLIFAGHAGYTRDLTAYSKDQIGRTMTEIDTNVLCDGIDAKAKTLAAQVRAELQAQGQAVANKDTELMTNIAEQCKRKAENIQYLISQLGRDAYRYAAYVGVGAELNLGKRFHWLIGNNVGGSKTYGVMLALGDKSSVSVANLLSLTPLSISNSTETIPIEIVGRLIAFVGQKDSIKAMSDFSGDYVRVGFDVPNPFTGLMKTQASEVELLVHSRAPIYAIVVPIITTKYSGQAAGKVFDFHVGAARLSFSDTSKEGRYLDPRSELPWWNWSRATADIQDFYYKVKNNYWF